MERNRFLTTKRKLLQKVLSGSKNVRFGEMVALVEAFGFRLSRVRGSHHIFVHPHVRELVNLQDVDGKAKPYQIRQFLRLVERYNLTLGDES
jgi:predicted RNA binding protein YcfA (HicA-like mRNA interferase family)